MLRHWRSRFGITAPHVAVRTHVPWHWRVMAVVGIITVALVLAGWVYDSGRRFAGFDRSASEAEIGALRDKVARLEKETARLRAVANASGANLQIEKTTRDQLTRQVKNLEEENTRLKENLAVFDNLAKGGSKGESINVSRLRVEPDGMPGHYRYRLLVSRQGEQAGEEFRGKLQFYLTVLQAGGSSAMIILPRQDDPDAGRFAISFRSFRTIEGRFQIAPEAKIKRVEVRLVQGNAVKASQSITF
jgi:Family of unknown function (DUF6776)